MAGIYIHITASNAEPGGAPAKLVRPSSYISALARELEYYARSNAANETIESIYIGGLTQEFQESQYRVVLENLFSHFDTINLDEVTLEIYPGHVTRDDYAGFLALGVTRIQILAGSFFDDDLQQMNAPFQARDVHDAIEEARAGGFEHIGVDLALDAPNQPYEYWGANLERVVHSKIEHLAFHRRRSSAAARWPQPRHRHYGCTPLEEDEKQRYQLAMEYLASSGYANYLWLEFARPGADCTQSRLYVQHANILGVGAGAHSFWWNGSSQTKAARWANIEQHERYTTLLNQNELPIDARSWFDLDALGNEFIMLQLQSDEGLDTLHLETEYGIDLFSEKIDELASLEGKEWIEPIRNNRVRLTRQGKLNYPLVFQQLILPE